MYLCKRYHKVKSILSDLNPGLKAISIAIDYIQY